MAAGRLRILQVMRAPVGGLFRHVADLTRWLDAQGHEIGLVVDSLANDSQTEQLLADLLPHARLGLHRFAMPRVLGRGDLTTPFGVRKLARALDIDIIHGHGAKGGFYARLARLAGGKAKAIYTPHGGVLHFAKSSPSGRVFHVLERWLMAQTSAIVFESAYAKATYSALIGNPTCPASIIHNGLGEAEFIAVPPAVDAADFVFVGELRALKGVHVLIEALSGVKRPDGSPARLVMIGDGDRHDALVAQIAALSLGAQVTMAHAQPARQGFARGRISVVPSLAESLPYIVLEAAAAQLPVISTRVGGIGEIFGPTAGSLVPANDPVALRAAMQAALDNPAQANTEMLARLAHVQAGFSLQNMAGQIEALYLSVRPTT
ncbi:MAG: glycosyltransferase [Alphaproteobacteria bacterium]|nr:glycosyltransferase [Alphaproteobacteria bacterium]